MLKFLAYFARFSAFQDRWRRVHPLARVVLLILALPGLLGVGLSILLFIVSILTLFLLCLPIWRLVTAGDPRPDPRQEGVAEMPMPTESPGRRRVDVTIIE